MAKIYRAYLSECVAILNQDPNCREVFINGDCVSGIFDTQKKADIDSAVFSAGLLNTLLNLLNWQLGQKGYAQIQCGIGIDYGRALMLKAGYKGSSINEIIWMGEVVNSASNLCHQGNKNGRKPIQISEAIKQNITRNDYLALLNTVHGTGLSASSVIGYEGDFVGIEMNKWIEEQKNKKNSPANSLAALMMLASGSSPQNYGLGLLGSYIHPKQ